jgi:hypothetical protein
MPRSSQMLFWVETCLAVVSGVFFVLTLLWQDWIEILLGVDPDNHSGSLEWLIALGFLAVAIGLGYRARRASRRLRRPARGLAGR